MSRKDLQQIVSGKGLSDLHVNVFQNLLKRQFPHVGGLEGTLLQKRSPLQHTWSGGMSLQILHTRQSHWAAFEVGGSDVCLYDSAYTSASTDRLEVIPQLVRSKDQIQVMNVAKQTGTADCALYAMAMIASLGLGIDPLSVVLNQEELRPHLVNTLEVVTVSAFPVIKHRRPASRVAKVEACPVYCYCRLPDNGETMVCCDHCEDWFHLGSIHASVLAHTLNTYPQCFTGLSKLEKTY